MLLLALCPNYNNSKNDSDVCGKNHKDMLFIKVYRMLVGNRVGAGLTLCAISRMTSSLFLAKRETI